MSKSSLTKRVFAFSLFMLMATVFTAPAAFASEYDALNGSWKCDPKATLKLNGLESSGEGDEFMNGFAMKIDASAMTLTFLANGAGDPYPFTFVGKKGNAIVLNSSDTNMWFEMQGSSSVVVYPEGSKDEAFVFVRQ